MQLTSQTLTYDEKQERVFSLLENLKNYNSKVKAYYLWLKVKAISKIPEVDLEKIYEDIVWSISETKRAEFDRKLLVFEKNKKLINELRWTEGDEEDEERKQALDNATNFLRF